MITEWHRYCESGNCIETRSVGDQVEIRDTERPEATLLVPAKAWEAFLASLRAQGWAQAVGALRDLDGYRAWLGTLSRQQWTDLVAKSDYVSPVVARAYLEALTEVRNNEGESR